MTASDPPSPEGGNGLLREGASNESVDWGLRSDCGPLRTSNEDFAAASAGADARPFFVVADGLGGHADGDVASRLAVVTALQTFVSSSSGPAQQAMRAAVRAANAAVFDEQLNASRGMGTTVTAATVEGREAVIGHVGDSRAYLVHKGSATQLTSDHSRVAEMLRMRLITAEQAAAHPARSMLTRSLGSEPSVQVDLLRRQVASGNALLLCSDGLWDVVSRAEMGEVVSSTVQKGASAVEAAESLVELALKRDCPDNVTALVVVFRTLSESKPPSRRFSWRRGA